MTKRGEPPRPRMPAYRAVIAKSFQHAYNSAVVDWGWKCEGEHFVRQGERVYYISAPEQLYRLRDVTIYLGHGWQFEPQWRGLRDLAPRYGWKLEEGP